MTSMDEPVPVSLLALDLPTLDRRALPIVTDDLGRECVARSVARDLLAEHREQEARKARHRAEIERQAIEADQAFRAALPRGIPADAVPEGLSAGELMMLSDPMGQGSRRETVLEHSLQHRDGAIVFHSVEGVVEGHSVGGAS